MAMDCDRTGGNEIGKIGGDGHDTMSTRKLIGFDAETLQALELRRHPDGDG